MTKALPYLSYQQVASELGCSESHVKKIVKEKGIGVYFFGGRALVKISDIIEEIENNKKAAQLAKLTAFK